MSNSALRTRETTFSDETIVALAAPGAVIARLKAGVESMALTDGCGYATVEYARFRDVVSGNEVEPATTIAERLKAALYVLGRSMLNIPTELATVVSSPEVHARCREMLNDIMLTHPVLMNPSILYHVATENGIYGTAPLAHALCLGRHTRFPMVGDVGVDAQRLGAWARNKHVESGLVEPVEKGIDLVGFLKGREPLHGAINAIVRKDWLIASLHELWRLRDDLHGGDVHSITNMFTMPLGPSMPNRNWMTKGIGLYARSLAYALGMNGAPCEPLLDAARDGGWLKMRFFANDFAQHVVRTVFSQESLIFSGVARLNCADPDRPAVMQDVIDMLVRHRLCETPADAVKLFAAVAPTCLNVSLPVEALVPVARVLHENGPTCWDTLLVAETALDDGRGRDPVTPWTPAARLVVTEASMTRVIDQVRQGAGHQVASAPTPARRHRGV